MTPKNPVIHFSRNFGRFFVQISTQDEGDRYQQIGSKGNSIKVLFVRNPR